MNWKYYVLILFALVIIVSAAWSLSSASQPHVVQVVPTYPTNLHLQDGNCIGTYGNGVGVSWPSINGTC